MMYPFMTLDDSAEIVHSEMRQDGTDEKDGFHHAECILPEYQWRDVYGFSDREMERYNEVIHSTAHLILQFAQEGGFDSASGF